MIVENKRKNSKDKLRNKKTYSYHTAAKKDQQKKNISNL